MSIFRSLIARPTQIEPHAERVDALCGTPQQLRGVKVIRPGAPPPGTRGVSVVDLGKGMTAFRVRSFAEIPVHQVSGQLVGYALMRNGQGRRFGAWGSQVCDGVAIFTLEYVALRAAVNIDVYEEICGSMMAEADDFDNTLSMAGWLR